MKRQRIFLIALLGGLFCAAVAAAYEAPESRLGKIYWLTQDGDGLIGKENTIVADNHLKLLRWSSIKILSIEKDERYHIEDMYGIAASSGERGFISIRMFEAAQQGGLFVSSDPAKREVGRIAQIKAKKWPAAIEKAAIQRSVVVGMTAEQVILAVGKPERVNRTVAGSRVHEQWVYPGGYVYMDNGTVTSFQDSR